MKGRESNKIIYLLVIIIVIALGFVIIEFVANDSKEQLADSADAVGQQHEHSAGNGIQGLSIEKNGYQIKNITAAPTVTEEPFSLSFQIVDSSGTPLTDYGKTHERDMHLIVVRSDGAEYRHEHPNKIADGFWQIPWQWKKGGSYRLFADFVPAKLGQEIVLSSVINVAGKFDPITDTADKLQTEIEQFAVKLSGKLQVGVSSHLEFTVTQNGQAVKLEPYLGAMGHLIALRVGDFAILHVHPMSGLSKDNHRHSESANHQQHSALGNDNHEHAESSIGFMLNAPTEGKYLLYLDFQVADKVYTAQLVITATNY